MRSTSHFRVLAVAVALLGLTFSSPLTKAPMVPFEATAFAQATLNATTTSAAVTVGTNRVSVASVSTMAAGQLIVIDREAMLIQSISGTTLTVTRGYNRTFAQPHVSGAVVFSGPPSYFAGSEVAGACTASSEVVLPRVVIASGNVYQCSDGAWVRWMVGGIGQYSTAGATTYTAAGAITVKPGLNLIGSGGALAMTLASPSTSQNGMIMSIIASTAQAHTITTTAGFNGGTTARDVCTLGGAIGDGITIQASGGVWYVLANRNCTLG